MRAFENHTQWSAVKEVCRQLKDSGYKALLAGGCVRDLLMNRDPNDFDIATDATPDEVEALFPKALTVGKAFGVTILPYQGFQIEVATFREDLEYKDGRRPEGVRFSTAQADAKRRDFTVNALFYDLDSNQVIDYVGGEADIRAKVIRTVGEPASRFEEDKLRLVRAVRFSAQLGFTIQADTYREMKRLASEVAVVSRERVRDELLKLLKLSAREHGLRLLLESGLFAAMFPQLASAIAGEESQWLARFELAPHDTDLSPALLLSIFFLPAFPLRGDSAEEKDFRTEYLKDLKLDNKLMDTIMFALRNRDRYLAPEKTRVGEMLLLLARPESVVAEAFADVLETTNEASGPAKPAAKSVEKITARARRLDELKVNGLLPSGDAPQPFLTGEDVKTLGIAPGPSVGQLLHEAYLLQLEGKLTSREEALSWAKAWLANLKGSSRS